MTPLTSSVYLKRKKLKAQTLSIAYKELTPILITLSLLLSKSFIFTQFIQLVHKSGVSVL